ncbi:MAG TPA: TIGR02147 family protein [bacterium]|nr:TIGR02147 family protein [bacterium]
MPPNPSIYDYLDYRGFLKDRFLEIKKRNPLFSYQSFSRLAGARSTSFLKLVMDGKRNVSDEGIGMIARGFRLSEPERKYFECLVKFNQAKIHEEKDRYFRELAKNKRWLAAKPLAAAQYRLLSHWYYVAILELVRIPSDLPKDACWIQKRLRPEVELKEVKAAVAELVRLDLLAHDKEEGLVRSEAMLATEDAVRSLSAVNFHAQMSQLAAKAVAEQKAREREFTTLTVVTSEKAFQRAREEIRKFRDHLHSILEQENEDPKDFVGHFNLQLFRLSEKETLS